MLVHGLGGQWQNWLENIPRLAQGRRVLALDLPGHGLTSVPSDGKISIPGYGRFVDAFCEKARPRQGRQWSATRWAASSSPRWRSSSPSGWRGSCSCRPRDDLRGTRSRRRSYDRPLASAIATDNGTPPQVAAPPLGRHVALALVARQPRLSGRPRVEGFFEGAARPVRRALRACLDYDFRDRLPDVKVPTLIVWGEKDAIIRCATPTSSSA